MLFVHITQSYFSHGAVMRRARQESKALLDAGHRVVIITDLRWSSHLYELNDYKDKLYIIPIKPLYIYQFRSISAQLSFAFKAYYALKKLSKKEKIDFIVSHNATVCYAVARFGNKRNIPSAWVIQDLIRDRLETGSPYNKRETLMYIHSNKYALKNMPFLIPVSEYTRRLAIMDGAKPENTIIKYNTVDTSRFSPDQSVKKEIDILFFGRLSIEKGIDILIDSTKYLSKNRCIVIIGDGPLANELKKQAKQVKHKIKFLGFIEHALLPQYIRRAKIVVTPSRSECHAAVPLESMACGVPVIASRVAGMEDTIQHEKNGWLLNQNNAKTLGVQIEETLSNEEKLKKISIEAIKKADFFSEKRFNKDIVKFYEMLIKKYNS